MSPWLRKSVAVAAILPLLLAFFLATAPASQAFEPNTGIAVGDGRADDTAELQSVLDAGQTLYLAPGRTYRITRRLAITHDGTGVVSDGTATLMMDSGAGAFDNARPEPGLRYGENAVGIFANGVNNPRVEGLRIRYEDGLDDRYVKAIAFRNCKAIRIANNNIAGFSKADGIVYAGASEGGVITGNTIHSSTTNSATGGQITGIVLDDDDQGSTGIEITRNHIYDLTVGPGFQSRFDYQTDGINTTVRSSNLRIAGNRIENVGEGIDTFSSASRIEDNRIIGARTFGIKLAHGASGNVVRNNVIRDAGIGGIVITGSSTSPRDTADNVIEGNRIVGVNRSGARDKYTTYGIGIINSKTTRLAHRNRISGNTIRLGGNALFGVRVETGSGTDNVVEGNVIQGWSRDAYSVDMKAAPVMKQ